MVELLQQNGLYEIFLIVTTIIIYRFAARFFEYVHLVRLTEILHTHAVLLLGSVVEDIAFIKELKYKSLEDQGMSNAQIWKIKKVDEEMLKNWKTTVIHKFVNACPRPFRAIIKFRTWDEAMQVLTEHLKRERGA
tara:strand:+ start:193 stop:597 length:405 start_codon:yes stop_codon:yes gene_type:complete